QLKPADFVFVGAREGPLDVAKKLAFQKAGRKRGAVNLDKRLVAPRTIGVQSEGQQFFAGAAFSTDQHGGLGGRYLADQVEKPANRRARADDVGLQRIAPMGVGRRVGCDGAVGLRRIVKLAASGRLPSELTLEGQDASLLLGDFLNLGAQIAVENLNRAVAFGALQSGDGQLGESRQQIQIFRSVRAGILSSQNQKGEKVSLRSQRETDFATE